MGWSHHSRLLQQILPGSFATHSRRFLPYEVEVFKAFYESQKARKNPLTPLDQQVLRAYLEGPVDRVFAHQIGQGTGIEVDRIVVINHRNTLIYGTPVAPHLMV